MKRQRISNVSPESFKTYIIDPKYIKAKADLESALKSQAEHNRLMDYCVEQGATEFPLVRVLHTISVNMCLKTVNDYEKWPNVLNGSPFLIENGYRDDFLDEFY